jgi:hypothetical protein
MLVSIFLLKDIDCQFRLKNKPCLLSIRNAPQGKEKYKIKGKREKDVPSKSNPKPGRSDCYFLENGHYVK